MAPEHFFFLLYVFLALYVSGMMMTLQLQHFALYPRVGRDAFREYIAANNKAAIIPSIVPALLLFATTAILSFMAQQVVSASLIRASFFCNCVNLIATGVWQGKIHGELERSGYSEERVSKLIGTNWVRTSALSVQAALAIGALARLLDFTK